MDLRGLPGRGRARARARARPDRVRGRRARARRRRRARRPPRATAGRIGSPSRGAWPSGKATGFGPVIPGSNPGAPAIPVTLVTDTSFAAVVMAGGLGTRMRSAVPKHLHPILGRRMVDWVLEAARPLGPAPLVVIASPETRDAFGDVQVAVQEQRARNRRRRPLGARGRRKRGGEPPRPLRRHAAPDHRAARRRSSRRTGASRRPRPCSRSSPRTLAPTAGSSGPPTAPSQAIVEAVDATPEQLALRECNSSIYVFRTELLWPALERLEPHNAQGELYLTDAVRDLVERGERVVAHVAADAAETEGVNTRAELAAAAAALRDRINLAHMLAGVTITDPASTWIEPRRRARGRTPSSTRSRCSAGRRGSPPARRSGRTPWSSTPRSAPRRWSGPSVTFAPEPFSGRARRPERSWSSRRRPSAKGRRCRTSPTSATRRSGGHEHRRGVDHRELPAPARPAEGKDDDRRQRPCRRGHYVRCSGHCWRRCVDGGGCRRHRRRPGQRARRLSPEAGQQGGSRWKA